MAVEHQQDFLLRVAVDATHGDVDVIITVNQVHAWHVGGQHLLQVAGTAVADHLISNQRGGHRRLSQSLSLTGGGGDGGCHATLDAVHDFHEGSWILRRRRVIWILLQQACDVLLCLWDVVFNQVSEGNQVERILAQITLKVTEVLQQHFPCLFYTPYPIGILCLSIYLAHLRIVLCRST